MASPHPLQQTPTGGSQPPMDTYLVPRLRCISQIHRQASPRRDEELGRRAMLGPMVSHPGEP